METKEILTKLGFKGDPENQEEVNNFLNKEVVNVGVASEHETVKELLKKEHGRAKGAAETAVKRAFRDQLGVDLSDAELEGKKLDDILGEAATRVKEKIASLEAQKGGKSDKEVEALNKEIEKLKGQNKDNMNLLEQTRAELQEKEKEYSNFKTTLTKSERLNKAWGSVKMVDDKYKVRGFQAEFNDKYKVELANEGDNSKDGLVIKDANGNRVTHNNDFITLADLIAKEASEAGVMQKSNPGKKRVELSPEELDGLTPFQRRALENARRNADRNKAALSR